MARYSRSSSRVRLSTGISSGRSSTSTRSSPSGPVCGGADQGAVLAGERDRAAAAGQADLLGDLGDRADLEELVLVARDEHDALVVADVDRERDAHVGEDDGVVEGDQPQQLAWAGRGWVWGGQRVMA